MTGTTKTYLVKAWIDYRLDDYFDMSEEFLIRLSRITGRTRRELKLALMAGEVIKYGSAPCRTWSATEKGEKE